MNKFFKILAAALVLLSLSVFAAACDSDADEAPAQAPGETETVVRDTVTISLNEDINIMSPFFSASAPDFIMFNQLYSRLVDETADGTFVPNLAHSWEVSECETYYIFNIRDDVFFHNGNQLTASDIVFSYEQARVSPFVGAPIAIIESVEALDDFTVRINLESPFAPFLQATQNIWVVCEEAFTERGDDFARNPVGSGPYIFDEHRVGQSVRLIRNDNYFRASPPIREVNWMVILNPATLSIAVEGGDIDMATHFPAADVPRARGIDRLEVTTTDLRSVNFLTINSTREPFDNILVRQAIAHAMDREASVIMAADGLGTPAAGIFNHQTFGYCPSVAPLEESEEMARQLLAEAGIENLSATITTIGGGFDRLAQVVQSRLGQVGIDANIELLESSVFIGNLFTHNYDLGILAVALGADANDWATILTSEGGMNMSAIANPRIDELFDLARVEIDPAVRIEYYREIAELVNYDASFIPIYFTSTAFVHDADLNLGWITATGIFRIKDMYWD